MKLKYPAVFTALLGMFLVAVGSLLPWLNIPSDVAAGFETESLAMLLRIVSGTTLAIGLTGMLTIFLAAKKHARGYVFATIAGSIIVLGILIFFFAGMSGSVRRALDITMGFGYITAGLGGILALIGSLATLKKNNNVL